MEGDLLRQHRRAGGHQGAKLGRLGAVVPVRDEPAAATVLRPPGVPQLAHEAGNSVRGGKGGGVALLHHPQHQRDAFERDGGRAGDRPLRQQRVHPRRSLLPQLPRLYQASPDVLRLRRHRFLQTGRARKVPAQQGQQAVEGSRPDSERAASVLRAPAPCRWP
eukprot:scaffold4099_cov403-Prasinococcus_capsulatus_cf.AAC.2